MNLWCFIYDDLSDLLAAISTLRVSVPLPGSCEGRMTELAKCNFCSRLVDDDR